MPRKKAGLSVGFLFDDTLDSSDGVAQHVKTLGAWLTGAGHRVSYLVGETSAESWAGGQVYSLARNIRVTFNGNRVSIPLFSRRSKIKEVLKEGEFDVLHVMTPYSPFMSQRVINLAPASTAVVGTFHIYPAGRLPMIGTRLLRIVYGRSLGRIAQMISVSSPAAEFCSKSLGTASVVIPNPVDVAAFKVRSSHQASKKIVFLGRLVKRKGCEQLLQAFAGLKSSKDTRLVIAGDGPERQHLEGLAAKLGIDNRAKFIGRIAEADKPKLLASAQVACFPSLYGESFGIVLVEAMAAGAASILAGDNPGYRSVLQDQPACLVDPTDIEAFSERLEQLLTDSILRQKLQRWQQQSVGQYDIQTVGPQVEAIYRQVIAQTAKTGHNDIHEK